MTLTNDWNEAVPTDENYGFELDDFHRRLCTDIRERGAVQHQAYADETGHEDVWEHTPGECTIAYIGAKADFPTPNTTTIGCLAVATDESNQVYYWHGTAWAKIQEPVLIAGNQTIAGTKTFSGAVIINGAATLAAVSNIKAGSVMSTSAAPTTDAMIANKKYVDDAIDATVGAGTFNPLSVGSTTESVTFPNGLIIKTAHNTTPSGDLYGSDSVTVTFGTAFPTACMSVIATLRNDANVNVWYSVDSVSKTGFKFYYTEGASNVQACDGFDWIAIGR